jgi:hypothetical protein
MKWQTLIIWIIGALTMIAIATATEYTESSAKDCINKSYSLSLFQGQRFGIENNTWKPIEKMASLKNTSIKCVVDLDGMLQADCLDYNATSRKLLLNISQFSSVQVGLMKMDSILRIYYPNGTLKMNITNITLSVANRTMIVTIPSEMSDIIHFGENSSLIFLNSTNNGILGDTYVQIDNPDTNYGSDTEIPIQVWGEWSWQHGLLKVNTSSIISVCPTGSTIDDARAILNYRWTSTTETRNLIYNTSDFNEGTVTWNTRPPFIGQIIDNISIGTAGWKVFNITKLIRDNYLTGQVNMYIRETNNDTSAGQYDSIFYTKEYATVTDRWWVNITCTAGSTASLNITNPTASTPMTVSSGDVDTLEFLFGNYQSIQQLFYN